MSDLLTPLFVSTFIATCIAGVMPLLLASVGETIGEQAGILNLGIEGMMLAGAYAGYAVTIASGSLWFGMLGGAAGGMAMSLIMLVLNTWFGLNQIVLGIAITIAGQGITSVLYHENYANGQVSITPDSWMIPGLSRIPAIGGSIFSQSGIFWLCLVLAAVVAFFLARTNWGLSIRAAGQKPSSLDAAGGSVMKTRSQAVLLGGFFSGIGGAYLSLLVVGAFTPFMTQGLGYIAIVVTMLSRGRVWIVAIISVLYGFTQALGAAMQLAGVSIPPQLISMLPYLVIMAVLLIFARSVYVSPVLGAPYTRGAR
jgi:simple sugar transport system permease protein